MHRFVETKSFDIRPVEDAGALVGHAFWIEQRLKRDVARRRCWLDLLEQLLQWKTDPGDHHGPAFNTPQTIDSLLEWKLQQLLDIENLWFVHQTLDTHGPRSGNETLGFISNALLRGVKLVEVVVVRDGVERR